MVGCRSLGVSGWSSVVFYLFIYLFIYDCKLQLFLLSHDGWIFVVFLGGGGCRWLVVGVGFDRISGVVLVGCFCLCCCFCWIYDYSLLCFCWVMMVEVLLLVFFFFFRWWLAVGVVVGLLGWGLRRKRWVWIASRESETQIGRERKKIEDKKWIFKSSVKKNRTFNVRWIIKWVVKIDKVVFWVAKS